MNRPIWISAGEPSGDMHGALLVNALRAADPDLLFTGMGGPAMRDAGLDARFRVEDLSVMGLTEVLGHLPRIFRMLRSIKRVMAEIRPCAVVVIDAPDFHFQVIKAARSLGIPVYYYISPKVWAWRPGRTEFIRQNVRKVISILPFEVEFYRKFGMEIDYVGNPLVDVVDYPSLADIAPEPGHIGLLPGSRKREITALLPEFAEAARLLLERLPHVRFSLVRAPHVEESLLRSLWPADVPLQIVSPENRWAFMRRCQLLLAASGTVTLESALAGVPTLAAYKVSPLSYAVARALVTIPYMSLANLILNREVFPEFLQAEANGEAFAKAMEHWLAPTGQDDPLKAVLRDLAYVREALGEKGAPGRAAEVIVRDVAKGQDAPGA